MVEPFPVFVQPTFEPSRKLPQVVNELAVQVLNASFDFALILRIRTDTQNVSQRHAVCTTSSISP